MYIPQNWKREYVSLIYNSFMTEAPIIWKPMDWFLYDRDLRHERVKKIA